MSQSSNCVFDSVKFESMRRHRTKSGDKGHGHDSKQQRRKRNDRRMSRRLKNAS